MLRPSPEPAGIRARPSNRRATGRAPNLARLAGFSRPGTAVQVTSHGRGTISARQHTGRGSSPGHMSATGIPADLPRAAHLGWDVLARLVVDAIVGPAVSWADSVESPVGYPLRSSHSGSATHQHSDAPSNDPAGARLPGRHHRPESPESAEDEIA